MPTTETDQLGDEQPGVLIARIESSWDRWLAAVGACSPEQLNQTSTCGTWSGRDLIGHVAAWDGIAVDKIRGIVAGVQPEDTGESTDDVNERTAREFQSISLENLIERTHRTHGTSLTRLAARPGHLTRWSNGSTMRSPTIPGSTTTNIANTCAIDSRSVTLRETGTALPLRT